MNNLINLIRSTISVSFMVALAFSIVFIVQGLKAYRTLAAKARAQDDVTFTIQGWKKDYEALASSVKKWEAAFQSEDSVQDLVSLNPVIRLDHYGLRADTDKLLLNKVELVHHATIAIGLLKVCLTTGTGFEVQASDYQTLFTGLKNLSKRLDISIGEVVIRGDRSAPTASLGDFCVLLRKR